MNLTEKVGNFVGRRAGEIQALRTNPKDTLTLLRVKLMQVGLGSLPFDCGHTVTGLEYYDHPVSTTFRKNEYIQTEGVKEWVKVDGWYVPYDPEKHGALQTKGKHRVVKEGKRIPNHPNSKDGRQPIHRHHSGALASGPYKYKWE